MKTFDIPVGSGYYWPNTLAPSHGEVTYGRHLDEEGFEIPRICEMLRPK